MNGTAHAAIGAATGLIISGYQQESFETAVVFIGVGSIAGLVPDLDIGGKLSNRLTKHYRHVQALFVLIGLAFIISSFLSAEKTNQYIVSGTGLALLLAAFLFRRKHMLLITGVAVIFGGFYFHILWLSLLGIFIGAAAITKHRSYTHSIIGWCFFGWIGYELEMSIGMDGLFLTCLLGYLSHLIADSRLLSSGKRGVPLLLPLTAKEF